MISIPRSWRPFAVVLAGALAPFPPVIADATLALPLPPERTLSFSAREGTWMSVDVSPDGRTLVFDLLGDVYAMPVSGGFARPLVTGMAFSSQPVFSPDGSMIAFVCDRSGNDNLWVGRADGSGLRPLSLLEDNTEFTSPAWSADGRGVYASRIRPDYGVFELWFHPLEGDAAERVTHAGTGPKASRLNALGAAASPDGRYLYYAAGADAHYGQRPLPLWHLVRRSLATGSVESVVRAPGSAMRPVLSPDGSKLVYATRDGADTVLRLRDLSTGADRLLVAPVQRDQQRSWPTMDLMPRYAFTPDGAGVIYTRDNRLWRVELADGASVEIPFEARVALPIGPSLRREVPDETGPVRARLALAPAPSPDGQQLAFSAFSRIYVMPLEGAGTPRQVDPGHAPAFQPRWSPDGRSLAYVTWTAADAGHVWLAGPEGGPPRRLTRDAAFYTDPVFAPGGQAIYVLRSSQRERLLTREYAPARQADLLRLPLPGGDPEVVVSGMFNGGAQFTREADRVHLYGPDGLVSVGLDGSGLRRLVRVTGPAYYFEEGRVPVRELAISPDGRWLLAQTRSQLYLLPMPEVRGGEPPTVDVASAAPASRRLTTVGADFMGWADEGRTIHWTVGSTFHRRSLDGLRMDAPPETTASITAGSEAHAIEVSLPRDVPVGALLLRGATAITMRGDEVIPDADILVLDGRIAGIGPRGTLAVPARAETRELDGRFVMPGLIDTHAHWFELRRVIHDLQAPNFLALLAFGVTSGLDVSTLTIDALAYQDMIEAGLMLGPRAWSTGPAVFSFTEIASKQDALDVLGRYRDHYRLGNLKQYRVGNRRQRQWFAQAAGELGMMPTTEGAMNLRLGLSQAIDGFAGLEHSLPTAPLGQDVLELLRATRMSYTPTLMLAIPGTQHFILEGRAHEDARVRRFFAPNQVDAKTRQLAWHRPDQHEAPREAAAAAAVHRAGGLVGAGSHSEFEGISLHWEMQALARGGLEPHEVLRIATIGSAETIGRAKLVGSLEPGKYADLLVLERNPLEDLANTLSLQWVMKNGRLYDAATLDELWPRQRPLPPLWFHPH